MGCKKHQDEDCSGFVEDLKNLVDKAYPELHEDAREQLAFTHYLGQLEQPQLAFSVNHKAQDLDEAVRVTLEMESYLVPKGQAAQVAEGMTYPEPVAAVWDQDAVMTLLQQVMHRMDQFELCLAALQAGNKPAQPVTGRGQP